MKIRFQADADLNRKIVAAVTRREPTIDFQTAAAAGLAGMKDPQVLALAAEEGRVLVSHDRSSMPRHFGKFITAHQSSGLIIVHQDAQILATADDLILIWAAEDSEEWINRITFLPL